MGLFSASPSISPQSPPQRPSYQLTAEQAQQDELDAANLRIGAKARQDAMGRTMGTQGTNALFTGGAAGYGRTMGQANV